MSSPRPGMVHGRFQPFHLGHLEYVCEAMARSSMLVVGITGADPTQVRFEASEPERSEPAANPFTYHLRARMIRDALLDAGIPADETLIVPFPVHTPSLWSAYCPPDVVHYLRVFSPWGDTKVQRIRDEGFDAVDLATGRSKEFSASEVRERLRHGGDWRSMVPRAVANVLDRHDAGARLGGVAGTRA